MRNNKSINKINDLSNSPLRKRFLDEAFEPETNIAIGMVRVSTKGQKDKGMSDVAQRETIVKYAHDNGLELVDVADFYETASDHNRRRKFKAVLKRIEESPDIKHLVISHQSRSNRNRESAQALELLIKHHGLTLHCARDGLQLTAKSPMSEWLKWDLFNHLNAEATAVHKRNVMDGVMKRIEIGLSPNRPPFGYKNVRLEEEEGLSVFKIKFLEGDYMRRAFELFSSGRYSEASLKQQLDNEFPEIKPPPLKRFSTLLRNPFYFGDFIYDGIQYHGHPVWHPRLITFDLWKRVQDILNAPHRIRPKVSERNQPYLGLIRCGGRLLNGKGFETDELCGAVVTGEEKRKVLADGSVKIFNYWHCSNTTKPCSQRSKKFLKRHGRLKVNYTESELEDICAVIFRPLRFPDPVCSWMQETLLQHHRDQKQASIQHNSSLNARHKMLSEYMSRAYDDKLNGLITEEEWREKHDRWKLEKTQVEVEMRQISRDNDEYIENGVLLIELAQRVENTYKRANSENKRKLIELVSSNRFLRNGSIEFDYEKPFDILSNCGGPEIWWR